MPAKSHGHGHPQSPTYRSWYAMIQRCTNPNAVKYPLYGARGITVCERWRSFEAFLADMGERPEGRSIDRINNEGPYEPDNCRWATVAEQTRNKRRKKSEKLTGPQVARILSDIRPQSVIAKAYGVTQTNISWIKRGASWAQWQRETML